MSKYKEEVNKELKKKTDEIKKELPEPMRSFISFKAASILSQRSLLSYATELREFCRYLQDNNSYFGHKQMSDLSYEDFGALNADDAIEFQASMNNVKKLATIKHYRTTLTQFFDYLVAKEFIDRNPFAILKIKGQEKKKDKKITYLTDKEKEAFLDALWHGTGIGKSYYEKNRIRDIAICELFLATGIRISELVGLDITDIYFDNHMIDVMRKGAQENSSYVYLSDHIEEVLRECIKDRERYSPAPDNKALFLSYGQEKVIEKKEKDLKTGEETVVYFKKSTPGTRINIKAVERMVKRYIKASVPNKYDVITPHKLRTTFASVMLRKTNGNAELVKDLMGHSTILSTESYIDSTADEQRRAIRGDE